MFPGMARAMAGGEIRERIAAAGGSFTRSST
jgi:hypothetical protein